MMLVLSLSLTSCGNDDEDPPADDAYLLQTSEDNVMDNFQRAYRTRDIEAYARLLAADFQFYFDPAARARLGIEHWTRTEDSLRTEQLITSPEVTRIVIDLDWPRGSANNAGYGPPGEDWTKLFITDVFLDVDFEPLGQDVTTYRVQDQTQLFYFRRGRTDPPSGPADTLVYLVEWRDTGSGSSFGQSHMLTSQPTTWSLIKGLSR